MKTEFLKGLGLEQDVIDKIMAENGKDIEKHKNEATEAKAAVGKLEAQLGERDKQLEELKKVDAAALRAKIAELQTANKTAQAEFEASLKKMTLDNKIEVALLGAKAKNTKAVRALLDEAKISLDGENVLGLNEQVEALKKDAPYLFGEEKPQNPPPPVSGGNPDQSDDMAKWLAEAGLPQIKLKE